MCRLTMKLSAMALMITPREVNEPKATSSTDV